VASAVAAEKADWMVKRTHAEAGVKTPKTRKMAASRSG